MLKPYREDEGEVDGMMVWRGGRVTAGEVGEIVVVKGHRGRWDGSRRGEGRDGMKL